MSSPLAKRQQLLEQHRLEQEVLSNINKQDQELREQRGFSRSPGQEDRVDEDEYNDRHNKHKENVKNLVNLYDSLESEISGIIEKIITRYVL